MLAWEPGRRLGPGAGDLGLRRGGDVAGRRTGRSVSMSRRATTSSPRAGANPTGRGGRPPMRDFAVSVGRFAVAQAAEILPARQQSGRRDRRRRRRRRRGSGTPTSDRVVAALSDFSGRFGPYPWDTFTLAITPGLDGGIEFPGHVHAGPRHASAARRRTRSPTSGSTASSATTRAAIPWLDEGLASYAEFRHEGAVDSARGRDIPADAEGRAGGADDLLGGPPVELLPRRLRAGRQRRGVTRRRPGRRPRPRRLRAPPATSPCRPTTSPRPTSSKPPSPSCSLTPAPGWRPTPAAERRRARRRPRVRGPWGTTTRTPSRPGRRRSSWRTSVRRGERKATELLDEALDRIAAGNEALNAFVHLDEGIARAAAERGRRPPSPGARTRARSPACRSA